MIVLSEVVYSAKSRLEVRKLSLGDATETNIWAGEIVIVFNTKTAR